MLPSKGYFSSINCPFFEAGACERLHCHFRHCKRSKEEFITQQEKLKHEQELKSSTDESLQTGNTQCAEHVTQSEDETSTQNCDGHLSSSRTNFPVASSSNLVINEDLKATPSYRPTSLAELNKRHIPVVYAPAKPLTSFGKEKLLKNGQKRRENLKYIPQKISFNPALAYYPKCNSKIEDKSVGGCNKSPKRTYPPSHIPKNSPYHQMSPIYSPNNLTDNEEFEQSQVNGSTGESSETLRTENSDKIIETDKCKNDGIESKEESSPKKSRPFKISDIIEIKYNKKTSQKPCKSSSEKSISGHKNKITVNKKKSSSKESTKKSSSKEHAATSITEDPEVKNKKTQSKAFSKSDTNRDKKKDHSTSSSSSKHKVITDSVTETNPSDKKKDKSSGSSRSSTTKHSSSGSKKKLSTDSNHGKVIEKSQSHNSNSQSKSLKKPKESKSEKEPKGEKSSKVIKGGGPLSSDSSDVEIVSDSFSNVSNMDISSDSKMLVSEIEPSEKWKNAKESSSKGFGGQIRISHVPNVNSILNEKNHILGKGITAQNTAFRGIKREETFSAKVNRRIAHVSVYQQYPKVTQYDDITIPLSVRQLCLNSIFEELLKYYGPGEARELAVEEELDVSRRVHVVKTYQNSIALMLLRLRKNKGKLQTGNNLEIANSKLDSDSSLILDLSPEDLLKD